MSRDEAKGMIRTMMGIWSSFKPANLSDTVTVWADLLSDIDIRAAMTAIRNIAIAEKTGFAPSPGQVRAEAEKISQLNHWTIIKARLIDTTYSRRLPE